MIRELGLGEALEIAMDAELKAGAFYAQASAEIQNPQGRDLLGRLASFEQYHYEQLAELSRSLQEDGQFIEYQTRTVTDFAPGDRPGLLAAVVASGGEAAGIQPEDMSDAASILSKAIENEKLAGERYRMLAEKTEDASGRDMFQKLANEEMIHQRILEDEFFTLSNQGVWGWSGLYGE
jgi:rubrerythrin